MRLYHYAPKENTILTDGILAFGQKTHTDIVHWMENYFIGRSRGIRCLTEPIQWHSQNLSLKSLIEKNDLFSFDAIELQKKGLIDGLYVSPCLLEEKIRPDTFCDEILKPLQCVQEIDTSPIRWDICNDEKGWRFAFIRYYLIILKNGVIPPVYLRKESR